MRGINKAILLGTVKHDPKLYESDDGRKAVKLFLETVEVWTDKAGTHHEIAEKHTIVVYQTSLLNIVQRYVKQGSKLYIEGRNSSRTVRNTQTKTDVNIHEIYANVIQLLDHADSVQQDERYIETPKENPAVMESLAQAQRDLDARKVLSADTVKANTKYHSAHGTVETPY